MVGECRANVSSPTYFPKWSFWRVLEFAKTSEFLVSTRIQQICRRVAIAQFDVKFNFNIDIGQQLIYLFKYHQKLETLKKLVSADVPTAEASKKHQIENKCQ